MLQYAVHTIHRVIHMHPLKLLSSGFLIQTAPSVKQIGFQSFALN